MTIDRNSVDSGPTLLSRRALIALIGRAGAAIAVSSGAGALIAGCGGDGEGAPAGERRKVTFLTVTPISTSFAAEIIADTGGHFEKEGLEVSIQPTRGSAQAIQAVLSGQALITRTGAIETMQAIADRGAPLKNVGMLMQTETIRFVSSERDPLTKPQDFAGKKMGIPSAGGTSETTLDIFLRAGGVDPERVERQVVGLSPGVFELVQRGRIDGYIVAVEVAVTLEQRDVGAVVLDPSEWVIAGQHYTVSQRELDSDRDTIERYLRAIGAATDQMIADESLDETLKLMRSKYDFPALANDGVAKGSLREVRQTWLTAGRENVLRTVPERWRKTYDQLVAAGALEAGTDPSKWYTNDLTPAGTTS